jgi:mono/diheme cytochrome c family protein
MFRKYLPAGALLLIVAAGLSQTVIKKKEMSRTAPSEGAEMYAAYCAACHGAGGKGDGPAAAAVKTPMPDLTLLTAYNDGEFPSKSILYTLGSVHGGGAHGSADMPVWGDLFRSSGQSDSIVQMRLYNLTRFLEAIQEPVAKPVKPEKARRQYPHQISPASGASMYASFCASCHGVDGTGTGPAAVSLKGDNLDLTQLTKRHSGKFPSVHVADTLGLMPGTTKAHGSQDMPVWGNVFRESGESSSIVQLRISNLVEYLKAIQR